MSYLVLARKWRPQTFADLIGQEPIVRILTNAISQGRIAHAYVFSGPRGVGKTTTARILAKALNCIQAPTATPCGVCDSCVSVSGGSSVDVIEIDGASNNSVDDVRDLRENVKYVPTGGHHKIYIIDEAHMLSVAAFNALLKTLEEPPPHVVFVLATTEARKIPATVMSRCQHLPFRRVSTEEIKGRLRQIAEAEGITASEPALGMIARAAEGSIRDSLTILDQVSSFTASIEAGDVSALLDVSDWRTLSEAALAIVGGDRVRLLGIVNALVEQGADPRAFAKDLIAFFRDLLVVRLVSEGREFLDLGEDEHAALADLARNISEEHLALLLNELLKAESDVKNSFSPRVALEMSLIRLSYLSTFRDIHSAISALSSYRGFIPQTEPQHSAPADARPSGDTRNVAPYTVRPAKAKEEAAEAEPSVTPNLADEAPDEPEEVPHSATDLLEIMLDNLDDSRLSSMLAKAKPEFEGETLRLLFSGPEAEICAHSVDAKSETLAALASELRRVPTRIEIHITRGQGVQKKGALKEKVFAEPAIAEALDLFDGRVLSYTVIDDTEIPEEDGGD